jgi:hypothetical protein
LSYLGGIGGEEGEEEEEEATMCARRWRRKVAEGPEDLTTVRISVLFRF